MKTLPPPTPIHSIPTANQDDSHLDLSGLIDTVFDNRLLIGVITLVMTLIGISYAILATPIYQSDILLQVEDNPNSATNMLANVEQMFDNKSAASDEMDIVGSRLVVGGTVDKLNLDIRVAPKYFPIFGRWLASYADGVSQPGLFGYGGYVWGTEKVAVSRFDVPGALLGKPFRIVATGGGNYRLLAKFDSISATGHVGTPLTANTPEGPLTIQVDTLRGAAGATFSLVRVSKVHAIEDLQKALLITEKNKDADVITASLRDPDRVMTSLILTEIGREYVHQNVEQRAQEAEKSLSFLEEQLPKLKRQLEDSEEAFNQFRSTNGTLDLTEEGTAVLQQSVDVQGKIVDLQTKRGELMARFTSSHPAVISIDAQLSLLQSRLATIDAKTRELPGLEQTELRLQRDVQVNTDLYTGLLNTAQQLRLARAGKSGNTRMVDTAFIPENPVKPNRKVVVGLSVLIGLFVGVGVAWVRKRWFGAMVQPHEVEAGCGIPVYAVVPLSKQQMTLDAKKGKRRAGEVSLLAVDDSDSISVESLRSFRSALQFILLEAENNIVLISGPTPEVGKSFVASNLAAVLAASDQRVLLIDADLRRGDLSRRFGITQAPGLAEIILGQPLEASLRRNVLPNLDVIARGRTQGNPSDLLLSSVLSGFLKNISMNYDVVIIDSPPVLAVTDATALGHHAGTSFLVVRQGVTTVPQVRESIKRFAQAGVPMNGAVFNGFKSRPGNDGYGYGSYAYATTPVPGGANVAPMRSRGHRS